MSKNTYPISPNANDSPRPLKRQKLSTPSSSPAKATKVTEATLVKPERSIPPAELLLSLPALLIQPPNHPHHARSLHLSRCALHKCLSFTDVDRDIECRAWTALAEVGVRILSLEALSEEIRAEVEEEVEKAVMKAMLIAQKHPSLRLYKPHLTILSASLPSSLSNPRKTITSLRRLLTSFFLPADPPHLVYTTHLELIHTLSQDTSHLKALGAIHDLRSLAEHKGHGEMVLLSEVLKLRVLVTHGKWPEIPDALKSAESALSFAREPQEKNKVETALQIHLLLLAVIFHTYAGDTPLSSDYLRRLHTILDNGGLDALGTDGVIQIPLTSQPLHLQLTHPRVTYLLVFVLSAQAKRDPVGRNPKKRVFAAEGLGVLEREIRKSVAVNRWAGEDGVHEIGRRLGYVKAELVCELVSIAIMRSEFPEAEKALATLIAHTRTANLFRAYAGRVTLFYAQLAHARGMHERAMECYRVAAFLSRPRTVSKDTHPHEEWEEGEDELGEDVGEEDAYTHASARAGGLCARIGLFRERKQGGEREWEEIRLEGEVVAGMCQGLGGTLGAVGEVLQACLGDDEGVLGTKTHLRTALSLSTRAQDNHLRLLVLCLIAAHYMHTSPEHAMAMLKTGEVLACGLDARPKPKEGGGTPVKIPIPTPGNGIRTSSRGMGKMDGDGGGVGVKVVNPLRVWIGERFLDLHRWNREEEEAAGQAVINERLRGSV